MTDEEIIQKIQANEWWPFDRVDPKILEKIMQLEKQQLISDVGEALL